MKKWNEYTKQEKIMIIAIVTLLLFLLLSWTRVSNDFQKGMQIFYGTSTDTVQATR